MSNSNLNVLVNDFFVSLSPLDPDYGEAKYLRTIKVLELYTHDLYKYLAHRDPTQNILAYINVLKLWNHVSAYEIRNDSVVTLPPYPFDPNLVDPTTHPPFPIYYYAMIERYEDSLSELLEILENLGLKFKPAGC